MGNFLHKFTKILFRRFTLLQVIPYSLIKFVGYCPSAL